MRAYASLLLLIGAVAPGATAELSNDTRDKLSAGLESLGPDTSPEQARQLVQWLVDSKAVDSDWRAFFSGYFGTHVFSPDFARFLQAGLSEVEGPDQARLARVSGLAAAAALGKHVELLSRESDETRYNGATNALAWLADIVQGLEPDAAGAVVDALRAALSGKTSGLVPVAGGPPAPNPPTAWLGAQLALILRDYAVRSGRAAALTEILNLQGGGLRFWQSYGVLLLDNAGLAPAQVESLGTLYGAIPAVLHKIGALIVPETTGVGPNSPALRFQSGQIVFIANVPMGRLTWDREFSPDTAQPVAAEFTVAAAQQIVRAIQAIQLPARPELVIRRTAILANAGPQPEAYLRRAVAPSIYLQSPDELLPSVAYLWFVDSIATFETALYLNEVGEPQALDQFLLFADLLSGGTGQTLLYITSPSGAVDRRTTAVFRQPLPPIGSPIGAQVPGQPTATYATGTVYLTGIILGGVRWQFDIGPEGIVARYNKWMLE